MQESTVFAVLGMSRDTQSSGSVRQIRESGSICHVAYVSVCAVSLIDSAGWKNLAVSAILRIFQHAWSHDRLGGEMSFGAIFWSVHVLTCMLTLMVTGFHSVICLTVP